MKASTLFFLIVALVAISCKKNKDAPPVVVNSYAGLASYKQGDDNAKKGIWFSTDKTASYAYTMAEIAGNKDLESTILFGLYVNKKSYELYGPKDYPFQFGQEKWSVQNSIVFKKPVGDIKELNAKLDENPKSITAAFIDDQYANGALIGNKVTGLEIGDVLVFSSKEGKIKGLLWIKDILINYDLAKIGFWIK